MTDAKPSRGKVEECGVCGHGVHARTCRVTVNPRTIHEVTCGCEGERGVEDEDAPAPPIAKPEESGDVWVKAAEGLTRERLMRTVLSLKASRDKAEARIERLEKALREVTGESAERLALDMDHQNKDHSRWYRAVKRGRRLLAESADRGEEKAND